MKRIVVTLVALMLAVLLSLAGCSRRHRKMSSVPPTPPPNQNAPVTGYTETGVASWYGIPFHGRRAADGEIYDMETLVAAHRLLPFNTWLKVTNLSNRETVNVRVIDRGPFVDGRIIDLSKAAARSIGLLGPGIGTVRLEVIAAPHDVPANDFYAVQTGAFSNRESAEQLRQQYAQRFGNARLAVKQAPTPIWRVLVGKESSVEAAQQLAVVLGAENKGVFVVRLDETVVNTPAQAE